MMCSPCHGEHAPSTQHSANSSQSLCVHLRRFRQWQGLTQTTLAEQTGLSLARLRHLERCRALTLTDWQGTDLDRLAKTFRIPLTALIAQPAKQRTHWAFAACLRAGILGLVVVAPQGLIEVRRFDLRPKRCRPERKQFIHTAVTELAQEYNLRCLVVEPDSLIEKHTSALALEVNQLTLASAKRQLNPRLKTHRDLCKHISRIYPVIQRLGQIASAREITQDDPWRMIAVLASALGLAFQNKRRSQEDAAPTASIHSYSPDPCSNDNTASN